jgi:hypothetical protein
VSSSKEKLINDILSMNFESEDQTLSSLSALLK